MKVNPAVGFGPGRTEETGYPHIGIGNAGRYHSHSPVGAGRRVCIFRYTRWCEVGCRAEYFDCTPDNRT